MCDFDALQVIECNLVTMLDFSVGYLSAIPAVPLAPLACGNRQRFTSLKLGNV